MFCYQIENTSHFISISAARKYEIHQMNVKTAFFNFTFKENIYIQQSKEYVDFKRFNHICKINKVMYELKQLIHE